MAYDSEHGKLWQDIKADLDKTSARASKFAVDAEWAFGRRTARVLGVVMLFAVVVAILWGFLNWYIAPDEPSERKDLVLALAQILGGTALLSGLYFTWRGQRMTQEQEIYRKQNEALQKYFEHMQRLITEKHLPDEDLRELPVGHPLRAMVEGMTRAVIDMLDTHRLYALLQFLYHGGLLSGEHSLISLRGVYLRGINLAGDSLRNINLSGAHFREWPQPVLRRTVLKHAILRDVDFGNADLTGADLSGADLTDAKVTQAQLDQAEFLEGATMPTGQKYADWLKDKEGGGEDEENSGPS